MHHDIRLAVFDIAGTTVKEDGEITAQYRYFDVYSKLFPKGKVTLPAADAKNNLVGSNYFVMIKKRK